MKFIILFISIILLGLIIYTLLQPDRFRVSRSIVVNVSPQQIFPQIDNLRNFNQWNPWAKMDPKSKETFDGPDHGVGAKMSWEGSPKVGKGSMTITEVRSNEYVQCEMKFIEPMAAVHTAEFNLHKDAANDVTTVTWSLSGENGFFGKLMSLIFSQDKMIGEPFEQGLKELKERLESETASAS